MLISGCTTSPSWRGPPPCSQSTPTRSEVRRPPAARGRPHPHQHTRSLSAFACLSSNSSSWPFHITFPGPLPSNRFHGLHRYYEPSDFCRCSCPSTDLPAYFAPPSLRSVCNHPIGSQDRLIHHPQRPALLLGFVAKPDSSPPDETESSSSPTDHRFASGCFPPRLAATQLPSATRPWLASTGTSTPLVMRHHGRTASLRSAPTYNGRSSRLHGSSGQQSPIPTRHV